MLAQFAAHCRRTNGRAARQRSIASREAVLSPIARFFELRLIERTEVDRIACSAALRLYSFIAIAPAGLRRATIFSGAVTAEILGCRSELRVYAAQRNHRLTLAEACSVLLGWVLG